jgi:hypothetical protein
VVKATRSRRIEMDATPTTFNAGPEYWVAPVPAAEAPLSNFSEPEHHEEPADHHRAFEAHDFGGDDHRG